MARRRRPVRSVYEATDENLGIAAEHALMLARFEAGVIFDRFEMVATAVSGADLHARAVALYEAHGIPYPDTGPMVET